MDLTSSWSLVIPVKAKYCAIKAIAMRATLTLHPRYIPIPPREKRIPREPPSNIT